MRDAEAVEGIQVGDGVPCRRSDRGLPALGRRTGPRQRHQFLPDRRAGPLVRHRRRHRRHPIARGRDAGGAGKVLRQLQHGPHANQPALSERRGQHAIHHGPAQGRRRGDADDAGAVRLHLRHPPLHVRRRHRRQSGDHGAGPRKRDHADQRHHRPDQQRPGHTAPADVLHRNQPGELAELCLERAVARDLSERRRPRRHRRRQPAGGAERALRERHRAGAAAEPGDARGRRGLGGDAVRVDLGQDQAGDRFGRQRCKLAGDAQGRAAGDQHE